MTMLSEQAEEVRTPWSESVEYELVNDPPWEDE